MCERKKIASSSEATNDEISTIVTNRITGESRDLHKKWINLILTMLLQIRNLRLIEYNPEVNSWFRKMVVLLYYVQTRESFH